ncbi:hypothetical protein [Novosphingobium sp.]|uniref:hypothetical protein n=1 Tax=Novosphingobium sp. TaxID=1874826 RepID=UPI0027347CE4|nr:hypothetical protein [Novosphingobium sp.]MDP3907488.1 hypothetical protein [Novosphingobium sp.]
MNVRHFLIFTAWSVFCIVLTGALLFVFTYGDCFDNPLCTSGANRNFWLIIGSAFVAYWAVSLILFRRWSR